MDFYKITTRSQKKGTTEVYPAFIIGRTKDLMVRGKSFYAVWDEDKGLWSTNEEDVVRLVDKELRAYAESLNGSLDEHISVKTLRDFDSNTWKKYREYLTNMFDNFVELDNELTFQNTEVKKTDHVSRRLPYPLEEGSYLAWDELIGTLYDEDERQKIEWAIGSIVAGDAKQIQKFLVIYGEAGAGKSTILNIIQMLFHGYYTTFEAKELTSTSNSFSTEAFKGNPLVAIQHDGDLSRIEDNSKLNAIVSHEELRMNEKYKPSYSARVNCFLFMGTNKPVKITDGKSGLIRRLIDVKTSGKRVGVQRYQALMAQIPFELGAIASHCLKVYQEMGKHYYDAYVPLDMMYKTDIFFNFVESCFFEFARDDSVTLSRAYDLYKQFCEESNIDHRLPRYKFRDELKNYFREFIDRARVDGGNPVRSIYQGFQKEKFEQTLLLAEREVPIVISMDSEESIFDTVGADYPAQLASTIDFLPTKKWENVTTKLSDINTRELHFVKLAPNHIVIDFDIKDDNGVKSLEENLKAASKWPPTYAEFSKSGQGVHLHYFYDGDPSKLSNKFSDGVEVKVAVGDASLRRKLTRCNNVEIAHINSGLPLKGEKLLDYKTVSSERSLRELILRNLRKEIHPGTKPSVDFIQKILDDAYNSGLKYDVTDMRGKVITFAAKSTNHSEECVKTVTRMKFASEHEIATNKEGEYDTQDLVFFDVEVYPNLFVVSWKVKGENQNVVSMINPTAQEVEKLFRMKLVGFNNRRYDNHILYARYLGYSNNELFELSRKIVSNDRSGYFREAYGISFTDIYDFSSEKKGLKAFQIALGLHHQEMGIPWDQPVPEDKWLDVANYCENDVISTEAVFLDRYQDFVAREILAELSGLSVNDTTQQHTAKIIFGSDKNPQKKFVYTDLSELFPGYTFDHGKSTYRGEDPGEGGYVYAKPGIYSRVALLDVASMHPTSISLLNLFGDYTTIYTDLKLARIAIKHKDFESAGSMLGGVLKKYLTNKENAEALAYALKIALNIVYGLTDASFDNPFRDPRNIDNIVAKRGSLFMIDLKYALEERGCNLIHIKTDSVKIANATKDDIEFVLEFGKKYGYDFEHEDTYSKFCLVNDAVYIAKSTMGKKANSWVAVGAQFQHPFVYKTLFSKETIVFEDMCETRAVTGESKIYLDMNEGLSDGEHNYQFVGRIGLFTPVESGTGGGTLLREKEGKYYAVTGTKGYRWLESEAVKNLGLTDQIDVSYYEELATAAIEQIQKYGDYEEFVSDKI